MKRVLLCVALLVCGCGESSEPVGGAGVNPGATTIVASIYPVASLVEAMVSEDRSVSCLLPAGASPHFYEPTASDLNVIRGAGLIVSVGLGLDPWVKSAAEAAGQGERVIELGSLLGLVGTSACAGHAGHDHAAHTGHEHGLIDPHIWLDPVLAGQMVEQLAGRIEGAKAGALLEELTKLDAEYRQQLEPFVGRAIVTYHGAFGRIAQRYGLKVAAVLEPTGATGAISREALREAIKAIGEHGIKVIFSEPQFPPEAIGALVEQTGVKAMMLDPLGDPNQPERAGYLAMMRYNLKTLVAGLSVR